MSVSSPDVYVQVPRTAGTSLRQALIAHHGDENVFVYGMTKDILLRADRQVYRQESAQYNSLRKVLKHVPGAMHLAMKARELRATSEEDAFTEARAVIGHFAIDRFAAEAAATRASFLTVVRQPLRRMVSHYKVAQSSPAQPGSWTNLGDRELPFADFALSEPVQNFQTSYTGIDPNAFAVLGTTEQFGNFLVQAGLSAHSSVTPHINQSQSRPATFDSVLADKGFVREFEEFHTQDYEFYEAASAKVLSS